MEKEGGKGKEQPQHKCSDCEKAFMRKDQLIRHVNNIHAPTFKAYRCLLEATKKPGSCPYRGKQTSDINKHMEVVHRAVAVKNSNYDIIISKLLADYIVHI